MSSSLEQRVRELIENKKYSYVMGYLRSKDKKIHSNHLQVNSSNIKNCLKIRKNFSNVYQCI